MALVAKVLGNVLREGEGEKSVHKAASEYFLSTVKILDLTISLYHCLLVSVKLDQRKISAGTFPVVADFCYFQSVTNFILKLSLRFCVYSHFVFPSTFVSYTVQLEVKCFCR